MANYNNLKTAIQQVVKTNGNNEITGALLQQSLLAMINSLGVGYQFMGVATPKTNPETIDYKAFYFSSSAGIYSNLGGATIADDEFALFYYDSAWHTIKLNIMTNEILKSAVTLMANRYYDTYAATVGSTYLPGGSAQYNGAYTKVINVESGDKLYIASNNESKYFRSYVIVDQHDIVTRIATGTRVDETITIEANEQKVYVNFLDYDSETDGIWRIFSKNLMQLEDMITSNSRDLLLIDNLVKTIFSYFKLPIQLTENTFYDTGGIFVGSLFIPSLQTYSGNYTAVFNVVKGDVVHLKSKANPEYFRGYVIVDKYNKVTRFSDSHTFDDNIVVLDGENKIFVNLWQYDSATDELYFSIPVNGVAQMHHEIKEIEEKFDNSHIEIVCFGDSITEFLDNGTKKGYVDYMAEMSGANCSNCGIGGTQIAQRTTVVASPTTNSQAYAALDLPNLVNAWVNNQWETVDAAVEFLKQSGDDNTKQVDSLKAIPIAKATVVTIMMGTNDYMNSAPLGTLDSDNIQTVLGSLNYVINAILTANPKIKLYLFTNKILYVNNIISDATWCVNYQNDNHQNLVQFNDNIKDIATKYFLPCCDMLTLGWNRINFEQYFPMGDTVHPQKNEAFKDMAGKMWSFIQANRTF